MSTQRRLTHEQESRLVLAAQDGDRAALGELVEASLWMVDGALSKMPMRALGVDSGVYEEMRQEGSIALARCVGRFDASMGLRLVGYASPCIRWHAALHLRRRNPFGFNWRQSVTQHHDHSLDALMDESGDVFAPTSDDDAERQLQRAELSAQVRAALGRMDLRPLERRILETRLLDDALVLREIAAEFDYSRQYVLQVQQRLERRLRARLLSFRGAA